MSPRYSVGRENRPFEHIRMQAPYPTSQLRNNTKYRLIVATTNAKNEQRITGNYEWKRCRQ